MSDIRVLLLDRNTGTHLRKEIFSKRTELDLTGTQEHTPKDRCVPNDGTPFGQEHRNTAQKKIFFQKNFTCFNRNTGTQKHPPKDRCVPNEGTPFGQEHRNTPQKRFFYPKELNLI